MNLQECRKVIIDKYPQFSGSQFIENSKGWSNYVVVVDDQYIFRFPRNEESRKMLSIEKSILPYFKSVASVNIPDFKFISDDQSEIIFVGYELITGCELSVDILESLGEVAYEHVVEALGQFLQSLHSLDTKISVISTLSIDNHHDKWKYFKEDLLEKSKDCLSKNEKEWIKKLFDDFNRKYSTLKNGLSIIHGDFTEDHILINSDNNQLGFIDFGDIALGDSAFDFAGIYISYGKKFMLDVLSKYKLEIDDDFLSRIEDFYIKQVYFHDLLYGIETDNQEMVEKSIECIREMMTE